MPPGDATNDPQGKIDEQPVLVKNPECNMAIILPVYIQAKELTTVRIIVT
jgi:hypothetical protein